MNNTSEKDELIKAQSEVIGVLFEVVKRLQANSDLDEQYLELMTAIAARPTITTNTQKDDKNREVEEILQKRTANARIVSRLLEQLET